MNIREQLLKEFSEEELEWRVQSCGIKNNKPWAIVLVYVQARAIQNRLDEIFGWENWTEEYREINGNIICRLGVCIENNKWIYKENGSNQTEIESFKGGISGAFKRVASSGFGIGRYLYKVETTFAECSLVKKEGFNNVAKTKNKETIYWKTPKLKIEEVKENEAKEELTKEELTKEQIKRFCTLQNLASVTETQIKEYIKNKYNKNSRKHLTTKEYEQVIKLFETKINKKNKIDKEIAKSLKKASISINDYI